MESISHSKINVSPTGLTVILGLFVVIAIALTWLLYTDNSNSGFRDIQAPVWQGGYDCPMRTELNVLPHAADKPCDVINPVVASPSTARLTDTQFLEYMIAHHQVAVNMSKQALRSSQNQYILELARRMVWQQGYEITMMHAMLGRLPQPFSQIAVLGHYNQSLLSFYKGLDVEPVKCYDDMFLGSASDHLPQITDRAFLTHMISHHELGLAMSRKQLNLTNNSFMLGLTYDIIHDQEQELDRMRGLASSSLWINSKVLGH